MSFSGVAIVVGAGRGIGRETAKLFATRGCRSIAIGDLDAQILEETKKQILDISKDVTVLAKPCDVTSEDAINAFVAATVETFGRIDYACNVAGVMMPGPSPYFSKADFEKIFSINATGMWMCQKAQIMQMQKQEPKTFGDNPHASRGAIVNVSSMAGLRAYAGLPAYCGSKQAILGFTKADGMFHAKDLIRINAVCPGVIDTPLLDPFGGIDSDMMKQSVSEMAIGRVGKAEEVAESLLWLVSPQASFVTATHLAVNGGMLAG